MERSFYTASGRVLRFKTLKAEIQRSSTKWGRWDPVRWFERLKDWTRSVPLVHVHNLAPEKVSENVETLRANPGYLPKHVVTSLTLANKNWRRFQCKVVTLTREPIGRVVSFALEDWQPQLHDVSSLRELEPERMIKLVMKKLRPGSPHADPGQWFEREL